MTDQPHLPPVALTSSEAWRLLRETVVGRLAVVVEDRPEIFPVNYLVDHGSIVFRTAKGTKLSASVGRPVAFEVDSYDPETGQAWSVVVKGMAREVVQLHEVVDALQLPLSPWHAAPKPRIIRIEAGEVSGRRFHVAHNRLVATDPPHRTAPE